jgi:hypothetical protein
MDALFDCLAQLADKTLGTVVHVGAGGGALLARYARLAPTRLVLVEGDPETGAELQRRATPYRWAEVHARPVTAGGGALRWNRYNLPTQNGPLDAKALCAYYPRLQCIESRMLEAMSLPDLLALLGRDDEHGIGNREQAHVLVIDAPGQEAALLEAWPLDQLIAFDAIVLRGCREALPPTGAPAEQAVSYLRRHWYRLADARDDLEPLWPAALLRFDPARYQTEHLQLRIAELQSALQQREQAITDLQAAHEQRARAAEAQRLLETQHLREQLRMERDASAQAEAALTEKAMRIVELTGQCDEQSKLAAERQAQWQVQRDTADKLLVEQASRIDELTRQRDEQAKAAAESQTQCSALTQAQIELERAARAGKAEIDALFQAQETAAKTLAEQAARIDELTRQRDEQARLATERAQELTALDAENASLRDKASKAVQLEATLAELQLRQRLMDEEMVKAEGQIELIRDVLLRETSL